MFSGVRYEVFLPPHRYPVIDKILYHLCAALVCLLSFIKTHNVRSASHVRMFFLNRIIFP